LKTVTGVTPYLDWLLPGQRWLAENWGEEQAWDEVKPAFLAVLGTDEVGVNSPDLRLVQLVVLDAERLAEQARETLTNEAEYAEIVQRQYEIWSQELELTAAAETGGYAAETDPAVQGQADPPVEPAYVEGRGWMTFDQASGEWVDLPAGETEAEPAFAEPQAAGAAPAEADAPAEAEPAEAAPAEATYVEGRGWMTYDAAAGEWVDVPEPASEQYANPEESAPSGPDLASAPTGDTESAVAPTATANAEEQEDQANQVQEPAAEPLPDLEPATAEAVDTAVMEEMGPVVEEALDGIEDLDLFSPEELQDILAAALEESGLSE
jgi:hypothetical protein